MSRPRRRAAVLAWALASLCLPGCHGLAALLTGPRVQVTMALRHIGDAPLTGKGTHLVAKFAADTVEVDGTKAVAYARGDVDGTYRGVRTSCICIEAVRFVRRDGAWVPAGFPLRRLAGVFDALDARERAFEHGDVAAYRALVSADYKDGDTDRAALLAHLTRLFAEGPEPKEKIVARTLRVERREALVTETWRIGDHLGRAHYVLRHEGDNWRFMAGLL